MTDSHRIPATRRLRFEALVAGHAAALFEPLSAPALYAYVPRDPPADRAALEARFRRLEARRSPDGRERWWNWVASVREDGRPVGLLEATVHADESAHVAYFTFAPFQRRGFAREGLVALVAHLHGACRLGALHADVDVRNQASIALLERVGFVRRGLTRDADFFGGRSSDEAHFRLDPPNDAR